MEEDFKEIDDVAQKVLDFSIAQSKKISKDNFYVLITILVGCLMETVYVGVKSDQENFIETIDWIRELMKDNAKNNTYIRSSKKDAHFMT